MITFEQIVHMLVRISTCIDRPVHIHVNRVPPCVNYHFSERGMLTLLDAWYEYCKNDIQRVRMIHKYK